MKKIRLFIFAGIALLMLTACPSDSEPEPQSYTQNIELPSNASERVVTLNQLRSSITSVENSAPWLVVELEGSRMVKLRTTDNITKIERKCNVTIIASMRDNVTKVILSVTQQGNSEGTEIDDLHNSQTDKPAYRRQ